jgi:hypothetical protein
MSKLLVKDSNTKDRHTWGRFAHGGSTISGSSDCSMNSGGSKNFMRIFETMTGSFVRHACDHLEPVSGMIR